MFGLESRFLLKYGIPFKEALAVADEMNVSLIVLGSHGRSAVQEMLAGSTFENVARLSRQPVLVVRSQRSLAWTMDCLVTLKSRRPQWRNGRTRFCRIGETKHLLGKKIAATPPYNYERKKYRGHTIISVRWFIMSKIPDTLCTFL